MNLTSIPYGPSTIVESSEKCNLRFESNKLILIQNKVLNYTSIKQYVYKTKSHKKTIKIDHYYKLIQPPELLFVSDTYHYEKNIFSMNYVFKIFNNKLYTFNFLNIDKTTGHICWGDIANPLINSPNDMNNMISLFWQSQFNYEMDRNSNINFTNYGIIKPETIIIQEIINEN